MLTLVALIVRALEPKDRHSLWFVLAGLVAMAFSDSTYSYLTEIKGYASGNILDVGWIIAYLGIALGGYAATKTEVVTLRSDRMAVPSLLSLVTPYVIVLLALAVAGVQVQLGHRLARTDWIMALTLVLLVISRQILLFVDGAKMHGADKSSIEGMTIYASLAGAVAQNRGRRCL
jgi:hypothetical protein